MVITWLPHSNFFFVRKKRKYSHFHFLVLCRCAQQQAPTLREDHTQSIFLQERQSRKKRFLFIALHFYTRGKDKKLSVFLSLIRSQYNFCSGDAAKWTHFHIFKKSGNDFCFFNDCTTLIIWSSFHICCCSHAGKMLIDFFRRKNTVLSCGLIFLIWCMFMMMIRATWLKLTFL